MCGASPVQATRERDGGARGFRRDDTVCHHRSRRREQRRHRLDNDGTMNDERGSTGRLFVAGACAAGFSIALVALVTSQLALMSIFDTARAERAAEQIAESRFTADVIEQTVVRAVAPVAGDDVAVLAATSASADPTVQRVVEVSLVNAHRQVVDPDAPTDVADGNEAVGSAIVTSILETADANGIDLGELGFGGVSVGDLDALDPTTIARDTGLPSVVPTDLPRLGLLDAARTTRVIALLAMITCGVLAVLVHPRPGRSMRRLGVSIAVVTGGWLVAMLVAGWVIGLISDTLFGEMIDAVWSDAVPSMLLLVGAGVVIGVAIVLGGIALDGYARQRRHRLDLEHQRYEQHQAGY